MQPPTSPGAHDPTPAVWRAMQRAGRHRLNLRGVHSRWMDTSAGRIHVFDAAGTGRGPTLVMLHGIGSTGLAFGPMLPTLRAAFSRVVAPELPGHGSSPAPHTPLDAASLRPLAREILDHVVHEPFVLLGNSMGGALALGYALDRPGRLRGLMLVSPAGARMPEHDWDALLRAFEVGSRREADAFLRRLFHRPPWYVPALAPVFVPAFRRPGVRDILRSARQESLPGPDEIGQLRVPTLLLWGRSEKLLPPSALAYWKAHLPREYVTIEEPDGYSHAPHLEIPRAVAARIVSFGRSLEP